MKKIVSVFLSIVLVLGMVACKADAVTSSGVDLRTENEALQTENETLKRENEELKERLDAYEKAEQEEQAMASVQETDVTVQLTEKSEYTDEYSQYKIDFVFVVTNNTEKSIKGIQGVAVFKDLFGKEIIRLGCDFVDNTIEPGASVTISTLSMDCNRFMDDHIKLYNTALSDLNFEYETTSIVFEDGTTKQ